MPKRGAGGCRGAEAEQDHQIHVKKASLAAAGEEIMKCQELARHFLLFLNRSGWG